MHAFPFRSLQERLRPAAAAGLALLLAACGGGGDDSSQATPLVITSGNAQAVTADALQATGTGTSSAMASLLPAAAQQSGAPMMSMAPPASPALMAMEINQTHLCIYGGKILVAGAIARTDALTAGDRITLTAQGCHMNPTYTLNGGLGFTVLAGGVTGNAAYPYAVTVQVDALNLSLDMSGYVQTVAGDTRIAASADSATSHSLVLSGSSLRYSSVAYTWTLKNYSQSLLLANGGVTGTTTATVVTSNPMLGATVTYDVSTPAALVVDAAGDVVAGSIKVVSGGTSLLATVTAVNVFTVQVDTDGDGTYDQTQTATVSQLQATR